jgi:hypothetical protein
VVTSFTLGLWRVCTQPVCHRNDGRAVHTAA